MINLSQYFQRIAFTGEAKPDLATLNALTFAHSTHIPFENISVLNKETIHIEPEALFEKLVLRKRGGYCFEQNGLFLEVLKQIGFHVEPPTHCNTPHTIPAVFNMKTTNGMPRFYTATLGKMFINLAANSCPSPTAKSPTGTPAPAQTPTLPMT